MNKAIIDIETGGFSLTKSAIVEIGIIVIDENYNILYEYRELIKPYHQRDSVELMEYSEAAEIIHGYTLDQLRKEGKDRKDVVHDIAGIVQHFEISTFIGHNIEKFDLPRLIEFWSRCEDWDHPFKEVDDTLLMSRERLTSSNYGLSFLCNGLNIKHNGAHTAIGDCKATLELYKILVCGYLE